jgi:hypothetical protein
MASDDGFYSRAMLIKLDKAISSLLVQLDFGNDSIDWTMCAVGEIHVGIHNQELKHIG